MTNHYLGINRGQQGFGDSDFTYGTSSGSTDYELRIDDSKHSDIKDVILALDAFKRFLVQPNVHIAATFLINPISEN
jgi:hypothetical protein